MDISLGEYECHWGMEFTEGDVDPAHQQYSLGGACLYQGCTSKTIYKSASSVKKHYRTENKKIFDYQCMLCSYGHEEQTTMKIDPWDLCSFGILA